MLQYFFLYIYFMKTICTQLNLNFCNNNNTWMLQVLIIHCTLSSISQRVLFYFFYTYSFRFILVVILKIYMNVFRIKIHF